MLELAVGMEGREDDKEGPPGPVTLKTDGHLSRCSQVRCCGIQDEGTGKDMSSGPGFQQLLLLLEDLRAKGPESQRAGDPAEPLPPASSRSPVGT